MQTVRDACQLQPNALSIKLSDQIEQLDELIHAEGEGVQFFEKTHITQGMQDLIGEGISRLAGASSQAVFHLKQAMGGGKTHLLVGFGLLARHPELRRKTCGGLPHAQAFDAVNIAAFNGRNNPDHFFWGEIANQLGKGEQFRAFWTSGPKAPDEKDWLRLFDGSEPILILLDEMPPYFHYLDTQRVGNGTVADIATRAFANLLTAAGKKRNVCIVVSDLAASYDTGTRLINRALEDARAELGRQERNITPVDLAANEIYDILRKRLFKTLPDRAQIADIADSYGRKLEEASKSKVANRGAEAIADEIFATYPFHPRLKNVIALFKENKQFKQTRGLIEIVSRLLRSVWERKDNDVFLIGPQHFDLGVPEVRDKLTEISGMRDVIARDLWDGNASAHAQVIDLKTGKESATQIGSLLLTASLSTAVNAVKGLTREEMVECLVSPLREPSEFLAAFEELEKSAWYIHHTPEDRYYFDRQENLTKLLQSLARDAPENQVDDLIRSRLTSMFRAARKTAYEDVLPLPRIEDAADRVRKGRVLLIVSPDSKIPPEEVQKFFDGLSQKNNLCVLTGDKTAMGSVEKAARQLYAVQKAEGRIPKDHPQREDLEKKQQTYELDFTATILNLFDKVFFPIHRAGKPAQLASKPLDMSRDTKKDFDGEAQIEKTLGLIFHDSEERRLLLERKYGTIVLDEAHKARRRGGLGNRGNTPNNLLDFMLYVGPRTKHLLLATATPIQTEVRELWDLMRILNAGADFVLGRESLSNWADCRKSLPIVKGDELPLDEREAWEWLRNPLPPGDQEPTFAGLRLQLGIPETAFFTDRGFGSLGFFERQTVTATLAPGFFREHNPIVRHTIFRRRQTLEDAGLLERIAVDIHPDPRLPASNYRGVEF